MSDHIRKAILSSDVSRYRIAQETGIEQSMLSRFVCEERGLSMDALNILFEYFDLDIVHRGKRRA